MPLFLIGLGAWAKNAFTALLENPTLLAWCVSAALFLLLAMDHGRLNHARLALAAERAAHAVDLAACKANDARLSKAVADQNAAIAAMAAAGAADTARAQLAADAARASAAGLRTKVAAIAAMKLAPGCAGVDQLRRLGAAQ